MCRAFILLLGCAALATAAPGFARTFKVLDTTSGKPVAGAEIWLIATGTLPTPGHPGSIPLGEWRIRTDENGEATLTALFSGRAWPASVSRKGYAQIQTVHEYHYRQSREARPDVLFLTPSADAAYETIRFHYFEPVIAGRTAGGHVLFAIAVRYPQAKRIARSPRELEALRKFCEFAPGMIEQRATGWPQIGTLPELRQAAQELIDDCAKAPEAQ